MGLECIISDPFKREHKRRYMTHTVKEVRY